MKNPIIGQKINDKAIDSLIDDLESIADANAEFYVGYPVAATAEASITSPALLISLKYGLVCFDVVPSANPSNIPELKGKQRAIVLALKAKLLQHPDLAGEEDGRRVDRVRLRNSILLELRVHGHPAEAPELQRQRRQQ